MLIAYMQFVYVLLGMCIILLQNQLLLAIWRACLGPKKYDQCNTGATGQLLISVNITIAVLQVHTYIKSAKQADLQEESRNNLEISL